MYQQLLEFLGNVPFFQTVAFGIISMVVVGASWCLVGAIAGKAPKAGFAMEYLLFSGALISVISGVLLLKLSGSWGAGDTGCKALYLTLGAFFVAGICCFVQHMTMSKAMQHGPNGIIWTVIQSAMIFPFIVGIIFYDVKLTPLRLAGIVFMLTSLALFGMAKSGSSGKGAWKLLTFTALAVVVADQVMLSIPFYYKETAAISPVLCTILCMAGYAVSSLVYMIFRMDKAYALEIKRCVKCRNFWIYSLGLLPVSGLFSFTLHWPGMRAMADNGLGSMSFPATVGSCIVAFTFYSTIILKEKLRKVELIALLLCISALVCLCYITK